MKIQISGHEVEIDDADWPLISPYQWTLIESRKGLAHYTWYAVTYVNGLPLGMHRLLLGLYYRDGKRVDHKDGNGLNNTRQNIRIATHAENMRNRGLQRNNKLGVKGVSRVGNKWHVKIKYQGKWKYLGLFSTIKEAGQAYDKEAVRLFGEFARPVNLDKGK